MTIERFSIACGRKSYYDRLLDLVIAWEILLGHGQDNDSIKYKIIIRLLNLISNNRGKRELLYDKMRALYDARSAIVHRSDIKPAFECINNLESYEYIIRTAITVFTDTMQSLGLDHKKMIDKLDYDKTGIYEIEYCGRFN